MINPSPSPNGFGGMFRRPRRRDYTPWEQIRQQEIDASMAVLRKRREAERETRRSTRLISWWPVGAGLVLSMFAPLLKDVAESLGPWAMTLIFPFVVVAQRPEVYAGHFTQYVPVAVLFAQFPLEGMFARLVLRRGLRPASVAGQVCMFHLLGILELVMLSSVPAQLFHR